MNGIVDIGPCNLHNMHGAFKNGAECSGWQMKAAYQILKDSSAMREDYGSLTNCNLLPLFFCGTRWIEDG